MSWREPGQPLSTGDSVKDLGTFEKKEDKMGLGVAEPLLPDSVDGGK